MNISKLPNWLLYDMFSDSNEPNFCKFIDKLQEKWYNQIIDYAKIEEMWRKEDEKK